MSKNILIIFSEKETPFILKTIECNEVDYIRISEDIKLKFNFMRSYFAELIEKNTLNAPQGNGYSG